jgi:hypothetical protein
MISTVTVLSLGAFSPAFFWSEKLDIGVGHDAQYLNAATPAHLEQTLTGTLSALAAGPIQQTTPTSRTPEINVVFLTPGLTTDEIRNSADGLVNIERLLKASTSSVSVPFTTGMGVTEPTVQVAADEAIAYLTAHPELFTNNAPDLVTVQMPAVDGELQTTDELVAKITAAVSKASKGSYVATLAAPIVAGARRQLGQAELSPLHIERDLLTALLIGAFLLVVFFSGFCCLFSLQTPRKFDEVGKATE